MKLEDVKNVLKEEDIREQIEKNVGLDELLKKLPKINEKKITVYLIKRYVEDTFNKEWKQKEWVDLVPPKGPPPPVESGIIPRIIPGKSNPGAIPPEDPNKPKLENTILNHLETIIKRLYNIENEIATMKKKMNAFYEDHNKLKEKLKEDSRNFIDIFGSKGVKTTLNLNGRLLEEVKNRIGKSHEIESNDSKLINTAMLIALLFGDDKP